MGVFLCMIRTHFHSKGVKNFLLSRTSSDLEQFYLVKCWTRVLVLQTVSGPRFLGLVDREFGEALQRQGGAK